MMFCRYVTMERHIGRCCAATPTAKAQQYHWIAAMMSSVEAPIIWSITNGSELMKMNQNQHQ